MLKTLTTILLSVILSTNLYSQVGIGTTSPSKQTVLHVYSKDKNKGFRIPDVPYDSLMLMTPAYGFEPEKGLTVFCPDAIQKKWKWVYNHDLNQWERVPTEIRGRICNWDGYNWTMPRTEILF